MPFVKPLTFPWHVFTNGKPMIEKRTTVWARLARSFYLCKRIFLPALFLGMFLGCHPLSSQETKPPLTEDVMLLAGDLLANGYFEISLEVLESHRLPEDNQQAHFVMGMASLELAIRTPDDARRKDLLDQAVVSFRHILNADPDVLRVRLELARAFFLQEKDRLAREQFERVLAGNPPEAVQANIKGFLEAMHNRRQWRWSLSGQLLWESNFNNAPSDPIINLFGLPFRSNNADQKSSLGVVVSTRGTYRHSWSDRTDLVAGVGLSRTEFPGSASDSTVLDFTAGPEFQVGERNLMGIEGQVLFSFNDSSPYHRYGGRIRFTRIVDNRTRLSFNLGAGQRRYQDTGDKINNADDWDTGITVEYRVNPTITINGGISHGRSKVPDNTPQNSRALSLNGGITALLRNGYTLGFAASTTRRNYQGQPGIPTDDGEPREDSLLSLQATILRRDFTIMGFSPRLGVVHSRLDTNAQASSYRNNRLQLTMVRQF